MDESVPLLREGEFLMLGEPDVSGVMPALSAVALEEGASID